MILPLHELLNTETTALFGIASFLGRRNALPLIGYVRPDLGRGPFELPSVPSDELLLANGRSVPLAIYPPTEEFHAAVDRAGVVRRREFLRASGQVFRIDRYGPQRTFFPPSAVRGVVASMKPFGDFYRRTDTVTIAALVRGGVKLPIVVRRSDVPQAMRMLRMNPRRRDLEGDRW